MSRYTLELISAGGHRSHLPFKTLQTALDCARAAWYDTADTPERITQTADKQSMEWDELWCRILGTVEA